MPKPNEIKKYTTPKASAYFPVPKDWECANCGNLNSEIADRKLPKVVKCYKCQKRFKVTYC